LQSGCPSLPFARPACRNTVALIGAGNPNFALSAEISCACAPAGLPLFLAVGFPGPHLAIPPALLDPAYGQPCTLGMPSVELAAYAGVTHGLANPWLPLPIPPGLAGTGHVVTAQMVILGTAGLGLSASTAVFL
jgi:hypothetical protein